MRWSVYYVLDSNHYMITAMNLMIKSFFNEVRKSPSILGVALWDYLRCDVYISILLILLYLYNYRLTRIISKTNAERKKELNEILLFLLIMYLIFNFQEKNLCSSNINPSLHEFNPPPPFSKTKLCNSNNSICKSKIHENANVNCCP